MSALAGRPFAKMNGLGNEIVVVDLRGTTISVTPQEARSIHAAKGLAYDQLMVIEDRHSSDTAAFVRILNNDGTESGACGNGTRCVAYILTRAGTPHRFYVETQAGRLECVRQQEFIYTVDMGEPRIDWRDIPLSLPQEDTRTIDLSFENLPKPAVANMGNPHAVFFVRDIDAIDLKHVGPPLETHEMFPQKANISIAQVMSAEHIRLKVWERGVGITQACGSAACATAVSAARRNLTNRKVRVTLPGGDLFIDWRETDNHVMMTGPVELEFEGRFEADIFA